MTNFTTILLNNFFQADFHSSLAIILNNTQDEKQCQTAYTYQGGVIFIGNILRSVTAVKVESQRTRLILPEGQQPSCFSSRSKPH